MHTPFGDKFVDAKFLNKNDNQALEMLTVNKLGCIEHHHITGKGKQTIISSKYKTFTTSDDLKLGERCSLIKCPQNPNEFLCVSSQGNIFQIDLRCKSLEKQKLAAIFSNDYSWKSGSHHPLDPEVLVTDSHPGRIRFFDKRNFRMPKYVMQFRQHINHCEYSFDGSEMLAEEGEGKVYFWKNANNRSQQHMQTIKEFSGPGLCRRSAYFFGPKSEYIVGLAGCEVRFYDKSLKKTVKTVEFSHRTIFSSLLAHPKLPLIAFSTITHGIGVCAYGGKEKFIENDDQYLSFEENVRNIFN